mgnify:FL=1
MGQNQSVVLTTFSGLHTAQTLADCRGRVLSALLDNRAGAFVNDYRKAALAVNFADATVMASVGVLPGPGCFVVSETQISLLSQWACQAAAKGVIRRVFSDLFSAVAWAETQATLGLSDLLD